MPKAESKETIDPIKAREALEKEKQDRLAACRKEVEASLNKYNCAIDAKIVVSNQGNRPVIQIVPRDN